MNRSIPAILCIFLACGAQASPDEHAAPKTPPTAAGADTAHRRPVGDIGRRIESAAPGSVVDIEPGIYREHLRITKPLTLRGRPGAIIDGDASGDIIEITAPDVTVSGLVVRNTGIDLDKENAAIRVLAPRATIENNTLEDVLFGIDLREAPDSVIRGNRIGGKNLDSARRGDGLRLWRADNTLIENNTIHDGRDAILWYSTGVTVRGNTVRASRYGLHLMYSDSVVIQANRLTGNSVGVYLMYSAGVDLRDNLLINNRGPSGYGIGLKEADKFCVTNNLLSGNRVGIYIDGSPFTDKQPGLFTANTLAYNDIGVTFLPSARGNEFTGNNFVDNIDQVNVAGRGNLDANRFWSGDHGNYWSDYTGYDLNHDGIGDFVHESQTLFENLLDRDPRLRLFLYSPAQQAIEFIGRAVPAIRPEPKFADEVPLMRPVAVAIPGACPPRRPLPLLATSAALVAIGVLVGLLGIAERRGPRTPHSLQAE